MTSENDNKLTVSSSIGAITTCFLAHRGLRFFADDDLFHDVTGANGVNYLETLYYFSKNRVVAVQMFGRFPGVANEELRATRISARMGHRHHTAVVVLILASELAIDFIAGPSVTDTIRATTLNHEIRNHPMKDKTIVKSLLCKVNKVLYGIGSILLKKIDLHNALTSVYFGYFHGDFVNGGKLAR